MRGGFSLLEAVLALALLSAVAVGALAAGSTQTRAAERGRSVLEAASIAETALAELAALSASDIRSITGALPDVQPEEPLARYTIARSVTRLPSDTAVFELTVNVTWRDGRFDLGTRVYRPIRVEAEQ